MAVTYEKLFLIMQKQNLCNSELMKKANISGNIITRMKRQQYISLESIEKICSVFKCKIDDILEFIPENMEVGLR